MQNLDPNDFLIPPMIDPNFIMSCTIPYTLIIKSKLKLNW